MILRTIFHQLQEHFFQGKAIILLGARQVGKSTLLKNLTQNNYKTLWLDAENADIPNLFLNATSTSLKNIFSNYQVVIIDEAQKIPNIGTVLKLTTDYLKDIQIIATGSSAFELKNKMNEPLTGRKWEYFLYPFSFGEMVNSIGIIEEKRNIDHRLIYGYYPEIVTSTNDIQLRIKQLADSYLYKDVLLWSGLKKADKINDLLKALSYQIGQEVSYHEIGNMIGLRNETVENYITILEQLYIIFRLPSYHSNHRKELRKSKKIYFFDTGIRNAVINDFRHITQRQDAGVLWENWVISELWKKNKYENSGGTFYFWRTQDQQELDLIINKNGMLHTYEIKWNHKVKARLSKTFERMYPNHEFTVITPQNIDTILL